jgi:hypothetical protein
MHSPRPAGTARRSWETAHPRHFVTAVTKALGVIGLLRDSSRGCLDSTAVMPTSTDTARQCMDLAIAAAPEMIARAIDKAVASLQEEEQRGTSSTERREIADAWMDLTRRRADWSQRIPALSACRRASGTARGATCRARGRTLAGGSLRRPRPGGRGRAGAGDRELARAAAAGAAPGATARRTRRAHEHRAGPGLGAAGTQSPAAPGVRAKRCAT